MKLLSYNILGGFHFDEIKNDLNLNDFDILCLQEYPVDGSLDEYFNANFEIFKHKTLELQKQNKEMGLALLVKKQKYKIKKHTKIELTKPPMWFVFKQYLKLLVKDDNALNRIIQFYEALEIDTQTKFLIINTHLYWEGNANYLKAQVLKLLSKVSDYTDAIILCGDLNTTTNSKRKQLRKIMKEFGFKESKKNTNKTFDFITKYNLPKDPFSKFKSTLAKIPLVTKLVSKEFDYIFYKNIDKKISTSVIRTKGSDHHPLSISITK